MLARLASLTIPIKSAQDACGGIPKALLSDPKHVLKGALASAFGEDGLRPWRLAGDDGESFFVAGWLASRIPDDKVASLADRLSAQVHVDAFEAKAGDPLLLDLHASPQRSKTVRQPGTGKRRNHCFDAAEGAESVKDAYVGWIEERLSAPRTGLRLSSDIRIRSTRPTQGIYRSGERMVGTRIPQVEASVEVEVIDPQLFEAYLAQGLGPLTFMGYGSIIPGGIGDGR